MKFVLFFIVFIMYLLTKRYNDYDFFKKHFLDLIVQFFHIITLGYIFYVLVSLNAPFIALFCAYVLYENLECFKSNLKDEYEYENDEDTEEQNETEER